MKNKEFPLVEVAVALVMNKALEILWVFNPKWGVFALPMTKRRKSNGEMEPAENAAARAAAEVLGAPVRVGPHWTAIPELKLSGRDGAVRRYAYDVFRVHPQQDFEAAIQRPDLLWLSIEQIFTHGRQPPLSAASQDIISRLIVDGRIQGRNELTSVLIIKRRNETERRFLLRWNADWGFALPTKRRAADQTPEQAAIRVAQTELELIPNENVTLHTAAVPTFTLHTVSPRVKLNTFYVHSLFVGKLQEGTEPTSNEADLPLVWATWQEILDGFVQHAPGNLRPGKAEPGSISRTAYQILSGLCHDLPWLQP